MAYVLEIIQYKRLGFYKGQQIAKPCAGLDQDGVATVKKTQVAAAGLSAALDADTKLVRVRNLTGSQTAYVRVNSGSDTTNAAAAEAQSETLGVGDYTEFMVPPRVAATNLKIDIR